MVLKWCFKHIATLQTMKLKFLFLIYLLLLNSFYLIPISGYFEVPMRLLQLFISRNLVHGAEIGFLAHRTHENEKFCGLRILYLFLCSLASVYQVSCFYPDFNYSYPKPPHYCSGFCVGGWVEAPDGV